jgi:hypothetical protein
MSAAGRFSQMHILCNNKADVPQDDISSPDFIQVTLIPVAGTALRYGTSASRISKSISSVFLRRTPQLAANSSFAPFHRPSNFGIRSSNVEGHPNARFLCV